MHSFQQQPQQHYTSQTSGAYQSVYSPIAQPDYAPQQQQQPLAQYRSASTTPNFAPTANRGHPQPPMHLRQSQQLQQQQQQQQQPVSGSTGVPQSIAEQIAAHQAQLQQLLALQAQAQQGQQLSPASQQQQQPLSQYGNQQGQPGSHRNSLSSSSSPVTGSGQQAQSQQPNSPYSNF
jgi:Ca-activated chloride channel family protein